MQVHAAPHMAVLSPGDEVADWARSACISDSLFNLYSTAPHTMQVHAAPHVAVLSTGDEVTDPATPHLRPGAIRDANRPMLLAAAADAGASTMDLVST